jgi:hypothetical protein
MPTLIDGKLIDETPSEKALRQEMLKETMKHYYDLFKHITTLDTGAIVIMGTFLTRITGYTGSNSLVNASVVFLIASLLLCLFGMFSVIEQMEIRSAKSPLWKIFGTGEGETLILFGLSISCFTLGIVFLGAFIVNPSAKI